jgi:hypothetical protein
MFLEEQPYMALTPATAFFRTMQTINPLSPGGRGLERGGVESNRSHPPPLPDLPSQGEEGTQLPSAEVNGRH